MSPFSLFKIMPVWTRGKDLMKIRLLALGLWKILGLKSLYQWLFQIPFLATACIGSFLIYEEDALSRDMKMSFCVPHCSSLSNLFPMLSHRYKRYPVHSSFLTTFLQVGLLWPRGYTWKCGQVVPDFSSTSVISKGFGIELCAFKNLQSLEERQQWKINMWKK